MMGPQFGFLYYDLSSRLTPLTLISCSQTEWSREEEEKLLHLAKLMPCQWRTIGPIVGRTASQCLEHYEKLLDAAQEKEDGVEDGDDPRRLRPGEIDPNPESKPARPDPVDMDEDEKEMLSEARARLANTQGKKAKRKAREKQLMEARRIASLQKRRELKAAGIDMPKGRRNKRGVDYINEVPFERKAPAGFFEPGKEGDEAEGTSAFKKISLEGLGGKRRDKEEDEERKRDKKRQKTKQEKNMPQAVMEVNKLNDAEQVRKRSKLVLDSPQVNEDELEEIAKLQQRGTTPMDEDGSAATRTLMGSYADATPSLAGRTPMRTPRSEGDHLIREAQNLIALTQQESSLKGGISTPLHDSDFSGATPKARVAQTPNPMVGMTPGRVGATPGATPLLHAGNRGATPGQTPLRDQLGLNEDPESEYRSKEAGRALKQGLMSLPKASNEYEIMAPEMPEDEPEADGMIEEDAADIAERNAAKLKAAERQALKERNSTLKRKLPRPLVVEEANIVTATKPTDAAFVLEKEIYDMIEDDGVRFPVRNAAQADDAAYVMSSKSSLPYYSPDELSAASSILKEELVNILLEKGVGKEDDGEIWEETLNGYVFVPSESAFMKTSELSKAQRMEAYSTSYEELRQNMAKEAKKANKMEKKLKTLTQGYTTRAQTLHDEIASMYVEQETKTQELKCFQALEQQESFALPLRLNNLKEEVADAKKREAKLQLDFKLKMDELAELKKAA